MYIAVHLYERTSITISFCVDTYLLLPSFLAWKSAIWRVEKVDSSVFMAVWDRIEEVLSRANCSSAGESGSGKRTAL